MAVICTHCGVATGYRDINKVINGASSPEPKSVGLAFLFTFLFPGAGHLYIGRSEKGMPYMIANAIGLVCALTVILFFVGLIIWLVTFIMLAPKITKEVEEVNQEILGR
jgi:TM2 domain-containing membrane protein YozV